MDHVWLDKAEKKYIELGILKLQLWRPNSAHTAAYLCIMDLINIEQKTSNKKYLQDKEDETEEK